MLLGRPTTYKPEYCEQVVEYCKDGDSLTAFAADIGCCRDTITEWRKVHPSFSLACKRALALGQKYWEKELKMCARGESVAERVSEKGEVVQQRHNVVALIFLMKARFNEYKESFFESDPNLNHTPLNSFKDDDASSESETKSSI